MTKKLAKSCSALPANNKTSRKTATLNVSIRNRKPQLSADDASF